MFPGVGAATVFGATKLYSMRVWMKPDVMTIYGITTADVTKALNEQNIEAAPGKFGENDNQAFQYVKRYRGKLQEPEEFGNIIIKSIDKGQYLRLKDIARLELGSQTI